MIKYALIATSSYFNALVELSVKGFDDLVVADESGARLTPSLNPTHPGVDDYTVAAPALIFGEAALIDQLNGMSWDNITVLAISDELGPEGEALDERQKQESMWANLAADEAMLAIYKNFTVAQFEEDDQRGLEDLTYPDGEGGTFTLKNSNYQPEGRRIANIA